ncbi:hypothetical protein EHS25_008757 [Saitozyma podzolica]|uniref:F-box domain-containing protein n=1 Tax=Saitozyma podzolica TaxID=1890683 RepID=A0A427YMI9_9TREE|nr:hypothetical protein EHS25_008757 [Saitozyma podzolica]
MSEIRCGSLNSCPLQRIPPRRVVINDMAVCADPCTYARLFQTAEPSITFVFRSLFDSWNEAMKLQLLHAHLPPPKDHSPGGDRGRGCKTVRILFIGESGVDADTLDVSPDEEEALWDTATDCLSQLLNYIYGLEKVLEIDYFNAELEKKAGSDSIRNVSNVGPTTSDWTIPRTSSTKPRWIACGRTRRRTGGAWSKARVQVGTRRLGEPSPASFSSLAPPLWSPSPLIHPDLLSRILSFVDIRTLCACLRLNYEYLEVAGAILYRSIDSTHFGGHGFNISDVVRGAAVRVRTRLLRPRAGEPTTNFKIRPLKHIRLLDVSTVVPHERCTNPDTAAGYREMVSLQTLRIGCDQFDTSGHSCKRGCPWQTLHASKIVINDVMDVESGVLDKYLPVMRKAARVTLILSELRPLQNSSRDGNRDTANRDTANRDNSERKQMRILFAGTASYHEPHFGYDDDDQVPNYSEFEDRL